MIWIKNVKRQKDSRKELRNHTTAAEAHLWTMINRKQVKGLIFRRQFSIYPYVLDFYCPSLHLGIELDGNYHFNPMQRIYDYGRDEFLNSKYGITVLRFENNGSTGFSVS